MEALSENVKEIIKLEKINGGVSGNKFQAYCAFWLKAWVVAEKNCDLVTGLLPLIADEILPSFKARWGD